MKKTDCADCETHPTCLAQGLTDEALERFRGAGTTIIYKPRQVIFSEGGPAMGLFQLCFGQVKLFHSDSEGRDHVLEIANPGAVLGELPSDPDRPLSTSAEALTEVQMRLLPRDRLEPLLQQQPGVGVRLINALSDELATARIKTRDLALKDAETRLAGLICHLAAEGGPVHSGQRVQLSWTRKDMAERIGVTTQTAIRLLKSLESRKAIFMNRREMTINDADELMRLAQA